RVRGDGWRQPGAQPDLARHVWRQDVRDDDAVDELVDFGGVEIRAADQLAHGDRAELRWREVAKHGTRLRERRAAAFHDGHSPADPFPWHHTSRSPGH